MTSTEPKKQVEDCGCVNFSGNGLIRKYCPTHLKENLPAEPKKETNPFMMSIEELDAEITRLDLDDVLETLAEETRLGQTLVGYKRSFAPWVISFITSRDEALIALLEKEYERWYKLALTGGSAEAGVASGLHKAIAPIRSSREG